MKLVTALLIASVIAIAALANAGRLPVAFTRLYAFPGGDKLGHVLLYGALSVCVNWVATARLAAESALQQVKPRVRAVSIGLCGLVALEELIQSRYPLRQFSAFDLLASVVGIALAASVIARLRTVP